jgi:hypothetical protein
MLDWQPIETAPTDGTRVDLLVEFVTQDKVELHRFTSCFRWKYENGRLEWLRSHNDSDFVEGQIMGGHKKAKYWMPIPNPPSP